VESRFIDTNPKPKTLEERFALAREIAAKTQPRFIEILRERGGGTLTKWGPKWGSFSLGLRSRNPPRRPGVWLGLAKARRKQMFKASVISLVVLPLTATCALAQANTMTSGRPSAALNPEQCEAIWKNAVPSGDLLAKSAAAPFIVNFEQVDKDGSGDISKAEFQDACAKGLVKNVEN
jgi:hypothetical protein